MGPEKAKENQVGKKDFGKYANPEASRGAVEARVW